MSAGLRIAGVEAFVLPLHARMPFRFGISEVSRVPHVVVRVDLAQGGRRATGVAADNLMPKWFTKNPGTGFREDIDELRETVLEACAVARAAGEGASVFALWRAIHDEQTRRGDARGRPHLLSHFGASLIERALIDAVCRLRGVSFHEALRTELLGFDAAAIYPELRGVRAADVLPAHPETRPWVRHTVGLSDPLTADDLASGGWPRDGLPVSLADVVARHGVRRFKIKAAEDIGKNLARLRAIAGVLEATLGDDHAFTLDGNESWRDPEAFAEFWRRANADTTLARWFRRLRFVEQPLHRDCALAEGGIAPVLARLRAAGPVPPVIIDESDADPDTLARALELGYAGTTHKNCKGVFKSVANLALLRRREATGRAAGIFSGEDLTNVGPVALPQDLCVAGALGLDDLERNGHHYFAGLAGWPPELREPMRRHHGDLFAADGDGLPVVRIEGGRLSCASLHAIGLGPREAAEVSGLPSLARDWDEVAAALGAAD